MTADDRAHRPRASRTPRHLRQKMKLKVDLGTWAFAAFLLVVALAAAVAGVHDASLRGAGLGVTAVGAILAAVGVFLLIDAALLFQLGWRSSWPGGARLRPPCKSAVLVGFMLVILLGIAAFLAGIRAPGPQRPLALVLATMVIGASAAGLRFFRREAMGTVLRVGTAALGLVGVLIGVGQFWYQNQYAPTRAGRAVALKVSLERVARQKGYDVVRANLDYENIAGRSVWVIGSAYTLTGSRLVPCLRPPIAARVKHVFDHMLIDPQRSFMTNVREERPGAVLAAGKFVADGKRLDPSVPSRRSYVLFVPRGRYQLLRLRAELFAISSSVQLSQRRDPTFTTFPGDNELYGLWHVDDDSWLHDLISGRERWVVLRYELVDLNRKESATRVSPDLRVTARFPDPTWSAGMPGKALVERLFTTPKPSDSSEPFADSELALEPVAKASAHERKALACRPG